jgi:hypothetical protein
MATRWDKLPDPKKYNTKEMGKDVRAAGKALNPPSHIKGGALDAVKAAGVRGGTRLGGSAGAAAAALQGGYDLGRDLDERTGIGKKIIDKTVGPSIDRAVASQDRVMLSPEAKARIAAGELEEKAEAPKARRRVSESESPEGKLRPGRNPEIDDETRENAGGYKRGGGVVSASRRADGIAQRGKTKGKMY